MRRFPRNEEILGRYINDVNLHVAVITGPNVTRDRIGAAQLKNYSITETSCREDRNIKGGGGGVLIYHQPCLTGGDQRPLIKGELEQRCAEVCPNYTYDQSILVAGSYRPPDY